MGFSARLSRACRQNLAAIAEREYLSPGDIVGTEGSPGRAVTTIAEGVVALTKRSEDGARCLVGFRHPGDVVMPYRRAFTWPVTAQALCPCRTHRLRFDKIARLAAFRGEFEDALHDQAMEQIGEGFRYVLLRGHKGVDRIVAAFIVDFAAGGRSGRTPERSPERSLERSPERSLDLPLTRSDMAAYLGLRTETVSRAFGRLKARKLLALPKPKQVVILDPSGLEALAKGAPARARAPTRTRG